MGTGSLLLGGMEPPKKPRKKKAPAVVVIGPAAEPERVITWETPITEVMMAPEFDKTLQEVIQHYKYKEYGEGKRINPALANTINLHGPTSMKIAELEILNKTCALSANTRYWISYLVEEACNRIIQSYQRRNESKRPVKA